MSDVEVYLDAYGTLRRVGLLRRHAGARRERVTYEHDPEWLRTPEAFQFDPSLPLSAGVMSPPDGREMFGTLGDSAPDTWGRDLMRRRERRNAEQECRERRTLHETDFLLGVSDETRIGALRFRFPGEKEFQAPQARGVPSTVALGDLLEASQRILRGEETDEDLVLIFAPGSSLGGARPKASVYDQHGNLSIAKFPKETDTYSISRWEAIALDMAQAAGITTIEYDLAPSEHGPVFLTTRFDRIEGQRIPFISAMAMTEHNDGDDDGSYLEIVDALADHGANAADDSTELFRRIAFSILISNTDDHLRNHGFLWQGRAGWALSPCYDLNPVPEGARILKTRIDYDEAAASIELLREVSEFFGPRDRTDQIIRECGNVTRNWRGFAQRRHAPSGEITRMEPAFEHDDLERVLAI